MVLTCGHQCEAELTWELAEELLASVVSGDGQSSKSGKDERGGQLAKSVAYGRAPR
jgi:hypothetical protein